jgi:hypothetical protein
MALSRLGYRSGYIMVRVSEGTFRMYISHFNVETNIFTQIGRCRG